MDIVGETYDGVGILSKPPHGKNTVVRLNDDVAHALRIREHRIGLYNLLRKPIVEPLEQERSKTRPCTSGDRM